MMIKYLWLLLFVPFLQACPYESEYALAEKENAVVHPDLAGVWFSESSDKPRKIKITLTAGNIYRISYHQEGNNRITIREFKGFLTKVRDQHFANIYEDEIHYTGGGYLIYKVDFLENNRVRVTELDRYKLVNSFADAKSFREYLRKNCDNSEIFSESHTWYKESSK